MRQKSDSMESAKIESAKIRMRQTMSGVLCFFALILSGCATETWQRIDFNLLEQSGDREFKLGIVKAAAAGPVGLPDALGHIEEKTEALMRIPVEEICSALNERYALNIDTDVDRTPRIVKERTDLYWSRPGPRAGFRSSGKGSFRVGTMIRSIYYGNLTYDNPNTFLVFMGFLNPRIRAAQSMTDIVNVGYWMKSDPFNIRFYYAVGVISSGENVLEIQGVVADRPKDWFTFDKKPVWDAYIENAGNIGRALRRDLGLPRISGDSEPLPH